MTRRTRRTVLRGFRPGLLRLEDRTVPTTWAWNGGGVNGTNWFDAANWYDVLNTNNHGVPTINDDAIISAQSAGDMSPVIFFNGTGAVHSLEMLRTLNLQSGTLSLGNDLSQFGNYSLNGGTLDLLNGSYLDSCNISGPGSLTIQPKRTVSLHATTFNVPVTNLGTMVSPYVDSISGFTSNSTLLNSAGATIWQQDGNITLNGAFTNHGTVRIEAISPLIQPTDTLTFACTANSSNAADGAFNVNVGTGGRRRISINGGATLDHQGSLQINGVNLTITNESTGASTFKVSGPISIGAGTTLIDGGVTINYLGAAMSGGGTWDLSGTFTNLNLSSNFINTNINVVMDLGTTVNGPGTFTSVFGRTVNATGATVNAQFINYGGFINSGNTVDFTNGFINGPLATATVRAGTGNSVADFTAGMMNYGAFVIDSNATGANVEAYFNGNSFTNFPSGSIVSTGGAGNHEVRFYGGPGLNNQGSITLNGSDLRWRIFGGTPTFQNSGTIAIGAGTTFLSEVALAQTASAVLSGNGTFTGNITGTGTVSPGASTGTLTVNGNVSLGGFIAELNGTTPGTLHDQLVVNGTVAVSGALKVIVGYAAPVNDAYSLIVNNNSDPITGTFTSGATVTGSGQTFSINYAGGPGSNDVILTRTNAPTLAPRVDGVRVNDGSAQRSRVSSLTVTFDRIVTFAGAVGAAFTLTRVHDGTAVSFTAQQSTVNGQTAVTLSNFLGNATQIFSLADGRYTLTVLSGQVSASGQALDGDGDGLPGSNYTYGSAQGLFRFFGDANGDQRVDIFDIGLLSTTYNLFPYQPGYLSHFDFNQDGRIDIADLGQFSLRYLGVVP